MASPSTTFMQLKSFFHNSSRVNMFNTQSLYESTMKNGHRILSNDIWVDDIPFCSSEADSDNFVSLYPNICRKHIKTTLVPVAGTNNQLYRVVDNGVWLTNWIAPVDSVNALGETSNGFACKIYQNNDTLIGLTEGVHIRNYFNGLIEFQSGYTPVDLGYSLPLKITFYEYIGKTLADVDFGGGSNSNVTEIKERFLVTDSNQLTYTLSNDPIYDSEKVIVSGLFTDRNDDYTISGKSLTFNSDVLEVGKKIVIMYRVEEPPELMPML